MPGFEELQVAAPLGAALESLGWAADAAAVRDAVPTALRGHPVAALVPPSGRWVAPALGAALTRLTPSGGLQALLLAPPGLTPDLGEVAGRLAAPLGLRVLVAGGLGRTAARLPAGTAEVLVASPDLALTLLHRSGLPCERLALVGLAWPELGAGDAELEAILPELPKDAQRLAWSSRPDRLAKLVDRWARKAIALGAVEEGTILPGPVRVAVVPRGRRLAALDALLDVLNPDSLAVWVPDLSEAARLRDHLAGRDLAVTVGRELVPAACVVAYDLPGREELAALLPLGKEVVVLAPAAATAWLASVAQPVRPLRLPDAAEGAADAAAQARATVSARLEAGAGSGVFAVAPLLERWDAAAVAGALWELWQAARPAASPVGAAVSTPSAAMARIWAGAGKRDGATPADFVAALTKEVGLDRTRIGRIELRESFSLIEVPAEEAEQLARALDGLSIRRRRIAARVDRSGARPAAPRARAPRGAGR